MLLVAEKGREHEVLDVFKKWGLDAVVVGEVTDGGLMRVKNHGKVVAEIPAHPLAEEGPVYHRPLAPPARRNETEAHWFTVFRGTHKSHRQLREIARVSRDRFQALDHRAIRYHGAH